MSARIDYYFSFPSPWAYIGHAAFEDVAKARGCIVNYKPVLLGETFIFTDDLATQRAFLVGAAPDLSGTFEFFDGHDPRTMKVQSIRDAVYKATLQQFIALRQTLLAG